MFNFLIFKIMERTINDLKELCQKVRLECKAFLMDESIDKSVKPAIGNIVTSLLQCEFVLFCQDMDKDLENGLRTD